MCHISHCAAETSGAAQTHPPLQIVLFGQLNTRRMSLSHPATQKHPEAIPASVLCANLTSNFPWTANEQLQLTIFGCLCSSVASKPSKRDDAAIEATKAIAFCHFCDLTPKVAQQNFISSSQYIERNYRAHIYIAMRICSRYLLLCYLCT